MFHQFRQYYYYHLVVVVSYHGPFLPGTSFEPVVIPTIQASSFRLLYVLCVLYVMFQV